MPRLNAEGYPDSWETSAMWDGPLSVHFGYAQYGWVALSLLGGGRVDQGRGEPVACV